MSIQTIRNGLAAGGLVTLCLLVAKPAGAQGCVAVRPMSCSGGDPGAQSSSLLQEGEWRASSVYRHFRSFRHFRGDHEETHRVEEGTEVINVSHSTDLGLSYGLTDRIGLTLNVPLIYYDRSSLYEHYGNSPASNPARARFHTGSTGLGDIRLAANYWIFDPMMADRGNFALGVGVKAPTGESDVRDTFHKLDANGNDSLVTKPVDQSIQPGDGGWGFTLQCEGFRSVSTDAALYLDAFYLFNPRETNDTLHRGTTYHSVADQYAARAGLDYVVLPRYGLSASLGGRVEGVPAEDLIGGSDGRRRPGYIVSVEPGVAYRRGSVDLALSVPVALYRNRTQSVSDRERTATTGEWVQGDAAFADYLINFTVSMRFGNSHAGMHPVDMTGE